jgi:hypothetical protein
MVGDSVVFKDFHVQLFLKGQLSNVANVSVELSAVTSLLMLCCYHQFCCFIGSTAYEIRSSGSAHQDLSYSAHQGPLYSAYQGPSYSVS